MNFKMISASCMLSCVDLFSWFFFSIYFQMCYLYAGLCLWGSHSVLAMYAHLPHGLYRWLADEILHLPLLHGARGCCPALHLWDQLIPPFPTPVLESNSAPPPPIPNSHHLDWEELKMCCTFRFQNFPHPAWTFVALVLMLHKLVLKHQLWVNKKLSPIDHAGMFVRLKQGPAVPQTSTLDLSN